MGENDWTFECAMTPCSSSTSAATGSRPARSSHFGNEWLDAIDGSCCTSDGGDDFTLDRNSLIQSRMGLKDRPCGRTVKAPNDVITSQVAVKHAYTAFHRQRRCNGFATLGLMGATTLYSVGSTGTPGIVIPVHRGMLGGYRIDEMVRAPFVLPERSQVIIIRLCQSECNKRQPGQLLVLSALGLRHAGEGQCYSYGPLRVWSTRFQQPFEISLHR